MVNHKNLSRYPGPVPDSLTGREKIQNGPIYNVDDVQRILEQTKPRIVTQKCIRDCQSLGIDDGEVSELIVQAIKTGRYKGSEWCLISNSGSVAACDAYILQATYWNENVRRELSCEYYLKFAINTAGSLVLTISCHTS